MDKICFILKKYYALNQKEEENLKTRIKKCIENYGEELIKDSRLLKHLSEHVLLKIYDEINIQHLSHLICFYSFLIVRNIEQDLIIKLTIHSLDDFIKYKKELNYKNVSSLQNKISFYFINQCIKGCVVALNSYAVNYLVDSITSLVETALK